MNGIKWDFLLKTIFVPAYLDDSVKYFMKKDMGKKEAINEINFRALVKTV